MFGLAGPRYGAWSLLDQQQPSAIGVATQTMQGLGGVYDTLARANYMQQQANQSQQMLPGMLQRQQLQNQFQQGRNNYQTQTQPGLINAQNATSNADAQYNPLIDQAKYQGLLSQNNNLGAQNGLINASTALTRAKMAYQNAQTQGLSPQMPGSQFNQAYSTYTQLPDGDPRKVYLGAWLSNQMKAQGVQVGSQGTPGLLNSNVAQSGNIPNIPVQTAGSSNLQNGLTLPFNSSNTGNSSLLQPAPINTSLGASSSMPSAANAANGQMFTNPGSISTKSRKGQQTAVVNPDGTTTVYNSPTQAAQTQIENRTGAERELGVLNAAVQPGLQSYKNTNFPTLNMIGDTIDHYVGAAGTQPSLDANGNPILDANGNPVTTTADDRLRGLLLANRLIPEASTVTARMSKGSDPGEHAVADMANSIYGGGPHLASLLVPGSLNAGIDPIYNAVQQNAVDAAKAADASGYPATVNGIPQWVGVQNQQSPNYFTGYSNLDGKLPQQPQLQPNAAQSNQAQSQAGWQSNGTYRHSDGQTYTRAQLEAIAKGGK